MEYPATLYKRGSQFEWDGEMFDALIVHDEAETKAAVADGWSIGKPEDKADEKPARTRAPKAD